ncbi:MAG: BTAD domain-containing putative transcriptional regulator, partial [Burkholderiales bacterium]
MLALELLGPVRLLRDDAALPITVRKTLALLALLACSEPLPRPRVVDLLWPTLDEATGRRNLRRELARLREAGAAQAVRAEGDFLTLDASVVLDVRMAEDDLRSGFVERSIERWRGMAMDGLRLDDAPGFDEWLDVQRSRLQRLRTSALEVSARDHEQRGERGIALQRIELLLALDPLQEQHHRDAMRLLSATGRREAAIAQYERCRAVLRDELGLQPMAETEALAASLRGAQRGAVTSTPLVPPIAPPIASDTPRLPARLPFVGRSDEAARLEAAWRTGSAIVIEGEGGVGKTRLALDFASAHGPYALARCRSGDADIPYASFTRALRTLAGPAPDLSALDPWVAGEFARLLPELGAAPPAMRSAEERSRFFEACAIGWCFLAADEFDAVVLDDWQHADAASRALLVFVAQRRREISPLTAREIVLLRPDADPAASGALAETLQALYLALQPLDGEAVFDLVRQLSGAENPERFAERLQRATGGNPFFLAETLRQLIELGLLQQGPDGVWRTQYDDATRDYHELPLPASVRDAVLSRVHRLGAACVRVLEAAALAGDAFAPSLLAPACALSELDTVLAIERAVQARLLREHESSGFAFAHDLVQQALESSLSQERRRLVHRRLALGAEAGGAPPAQIARLHEASGERRRAVAPRLAAGDAAQGLNALADAVTHWRKGLEDDPSPSQALALRVRLMRALMLLDELDAHLAETAALRALADGGTLTAGERSDALIAVAGELARGDR